MSKPAQNRPPSVWRHLLRIAALMGLGFGLTWAHPRWFAERAVRAPGDALNWLSGQPLEPSPFEDAPPRPVVESTISEWPQAPPTRENPFDPPNYLRDDLPPNDEDPFVPMYWPPCLQHPPEET